MDEDISLEGKTPKLIHIGNETRESLISRELTSEEHFMSSMHTVFMIVLLLIALTFIFNTKMFNNVFSRGDTKTTTASKA
jgi:hypothetical protein